MRISAKGTAIALLVAACLIVAGRGILLFLEGEEGRLKRAVYRAKRYAERENIVGLTSCISIDYHDELGNDRRTLLFIAKHFFEEYRNILILINELDTEIEDTSAKVRVEATVYWQENDSPQITYDTAEVEAYYTKERKEWKLIRLKFFESDKKRLFNPMIG